LAHSDGRKIDEAMERGRAALALWRELGMKWLGARPGHLGIRQNVDLTYYYYCNYHSYHYYFF
jgi:hypothetical protein